MESAVPAPGLFALRTNYELSLSVFEPWGLRANGGSLPACDGKYRSTISAEATIINIEPSQMQISFLVVMSRSPGVVWR
jgi:hypothetical protein